MKNAIVVKTKNSAVRTITKRDGVKVSFNEQTAAIDCGDDFPRPFRFTLDEGQEAYAPGRYFVDPSSFDVGDFDALKLGRRVKLLPLPA